jgi:hypothetical protein
MGNEKKEEEEVKYKKKIQLGRYKEEGPLCDGTTYSDNEQGTTISSTALLKGFFYECIVDGNSFVNVRAITPKNQLESCENATRRQAETIEFILLIDISCGGWLAIFLLLKIDARIEENGTKGFSTIVVCSSSHWRFLRARVCTLRVPDFLDSPLLLEIPRYKMVSYSFLLFLAYGSLQLGWTFGQAASIHRKKYETR